MNEGIHLDQINWFLHGMFDELRPLCITNSMGVPWTDLEAWIQYAYAKDHMLRAAGVSSHGRPREGKRSWVSNKDKHPRHTHVAAPLPLSHAGVGMAVGCCELRLRSTPRYWLVCICFPTPGRGLPYACSTVSWDCYACSTVAWDYSGV